MPIEEPCDHGPESPPGPPEDQAGLTDFRYACPRCGRRFEQYTDPCPQCGIKLDEMFSVTYRLRTPTSARVIALIALIALGLLAVVALVLLLRGWLGGGLPPASP